MLIIRDRQLEAMRQQLEREFLGRLAQHLGTTLGASLRPGETAETVARRAFAAARRLGLTEQRAIMLFANVYVFFGDSFFGPEAEALGFRLPDAGEDLDGSWMPETAARAVQLLVAPPAGIDAPR